MTATATAGSLASTAARDGRIAWLREMWPSIFGLVAFFVVWELAIRVTNTPAFIVPTPSAIVGRFWTQLPSLLYELSYTLAAASIGLLIGLAIGIAGAVAMVQWRILERSLFPVAVLIKLIPFVAIAPLLSVWLGYQLQPKIVLAALITFFPVLVNCVTGLRSVDPLALEFFESVGANRRETLALLRWPASLPYLFAALKVTLHLAIVGASVGEYFAAEHGIGHVIARTSELLQIQSLFSAALLLVLLGITIVVVTNVIERRVIYWHESMLTSGGRA